MRKIHEFEYDDDPHTKVRPEDVKVGAFFHPDGTLAGILLVLDERELAALRTGGVVRHAAPSCFDETQALPVPIVLCRADEVTHARAMIEAVCALIEDDGEVKH